MEAVEKKYQFKPGSCIASHGDNKCPVKAQSEFTAREDGHDRYKITNVEYLGIILAACPLCGSHKTVEEK